MSIEQRLREYSMKQIRKGKLPTIKCRYTHQLLEVCRCGNPALTSIVSPVDQSYPCCLDCERSISVWHYHMARTTLTLETRKHVNYKTSITRMTRARGICWWCLENLHDHHHCITVGTSAITRIQSVCDHCIIYVRLQKHRMRYWLASIMLCRSLVCDLRWYCLRVCADVFTDDTADCSYNMQ